MARIIIGVGPTGYPIYGDDPDRYWVPPPDPAPSPIAPAPSAPPPLPPAPTPIDPKELAATLYDKAIPVALSDRVQVGGRIIEGPVERIIDNETTVSFIIGYYIPINYWDNTRTVTKLWFRGKEAWNSTQGALLSGLNVGGATSGTEQRVRFTTGTLDQVADAWSISRYGASNAVGYIPLVTGTFENIRTAQFGNEYPFTSVTVEDTSFGTPGDGVTWTEALDAVARYDGRAVGEFESIDVTGRILALIFGSSPFYFPDFLSGMRKIKPHWNIRTTDKLYIVEKGALDLNLTLDLAKIKESGEAAIIFHDGDAFDKQREMVANFIDGERDYEPNSVRWIEDIEPVVSTDSFATDSFNLPVVSTTSEMLADLTYAYYTGEMARATAEFTGMAHYLGIEPGDTFKMSTPELDHYQRATEVTRKVDFTVEVKSEGFLNCAIVTEDEDEAELTWINITSNITGTIAGNTTGMSQDGLKIVMVSIDGGSEDNQVTSDFATTWTSAGFLATNYVASASNGTTLVGVNNANTFRRSINQGGSWASSTISGLVRANCIAVSGDGMKIIVGDDSIGTGGSGFLYVSNDGGSSWSTIPGTDALATRWIYVCWSRDGSTLYAAATDVNVIVKSTDDGASFSDVAPIETGGWGALACNADGSCVAIHDRGLDHIFTSTNGGSSWIERTSTPASFAGSGGGTMCMSDDGDTIFAVAFATTYIYRSTDNGSSWVAQTSAGIRDWEWISCNGDGTRAIAFEIDGEAWVGQP